MPFQQDDKVLVCYPRRPARRAQVIAVIPPGWSLRQIRALLESLQDDGYDLGNLRPVGIRTHESYIVAGGDQRLYWPHACWLRPNT